MGRKCRFVHQRYGLWVLVPFGIFAVALLGGCPNPDIDILFERGNKTARETRLRLIDGQLELKLSGYSGALALPSSYSLELTVAAKFSKLRGLLDFHPENIQVLFGQCVLQKDTRRGYIDSANLTTTDKSYRTSFHFTANLETGGSSEDNVPNDDKLRIILNGFVYYKGLAVPIDTIVAIEPKTKLGLACQR